jgi:hypothetical protein
MPHAIRNQKLKEWFATGRHNNRILTLKAFTRSIHRNIEKERNHIPSEERVVILASYKDSVN